MEDRIAQARDLFLKKANCAQAVLGAFCEDCGLELETALRLASGFGGGIARLREVCGAVSGMVMAADLLYGYSDLGDKALKDGHYARIRRLTDAFREKTGAILCRDLLGLDASRSASPVSEARNPEYYRKRPCVEMVATAAQILQEEIQLNPPHKGNA